MTAPRLSPLWTVLPLLAAILLVVPAWAAQADISRFVGSYEGSAEVMSADGTKRQRDMNVR